MGAARIFCRGAKIEAPTGERRRREVEAPQAPRGVRCGEGFPPPHWARGLGGGCAPSPENFSIFELKKASFGAFWVLFFEVELNGTFFTLK